MATNFKITQVKGKATPTGYYESKAVHQQEMKRIENVEKELNATRLKVWIRLIVVALKKTLRYQICGNIKELALHQAICRC